ncbi:MAG TPA: hypothetical protein VEJ63_24200 [Planctomycetota bacterium]|nr:hypothetical protein [Planctomycetota bacterium]
MWKIAAVLLLLAVAVQAAEKQKSFFEEWAEYNKAKDEAFANEEKKLWKKIRWQTSTAEAMKLAQKEKKPIVVLLLVSESGNPAAEQC